MDVENAQFELSDLFCSLSECVKSSCKAQEVGPSDCELQIQYVKELDWMNVETILVESVWQDDSVKLISLSKRLSEMSLNQEDFDGNADEEQEPIDRGIATRLLQLCCKVDAVECATALIEGKTGLVPHVNEMDESGRTALHYAAEMHATSCVKLLLDKGARTDLKSKDGNAQLPLDMALSSKCMQVLWDPEQSIEDLLILLSEKDLSTIRLLIENTTDIAQVAYVNAMEGRITLLAALLMVSAEKVNAPITILRSDSKATTTIYECVIREAITLGHGHHKGVSLRAAAKRLAWNNSTSDKRRLLLCEIELLHLFGAVVQTGSKDQRVTSPLIRASQVGDEAVVKQLVNTSIDINDVDVEGNSALHSCLKTCSKTPSVAWLLLKHGARVSQRNRLGLTPVHVAAANGNLQALQILLPQDPECVHAVSEMKETPLFFAVKNDFIECAKFLLFYGASSQVLNLRKQRPIDLAKSEEMRILLSPTSIRYSKHAVPMRLNSTDWEKIPDADTDTWEVFLGEDSSGERLCTDAKTEICRYFESPGGCVRGAKCLYAHEKGETRQIMPGLPESGPHFAPNYSSEDLKRKIFIGGLPPSVDSDTLRGFFEEQFGSVEDAVVIGREAGDYMCSRGFGFVTFKYEESVAAAVQAHYITILGKKVEIKSAVPKLTLFTELLPKSSVWQQQQQQHQCQPQLLKPSERVSWLEKLIGSQQRTERNAKTNSGDQSLPTWVITFRNWLPGFLQEVSKRLKEGEWYPLSSLKGDFRATCGLELDHASLGYIKLSDFMRSFPGICRMRVVPIGGRGIATHMVLLPNLAKPNHHHPHLLTTKPQHLYSGFPSIDNSDYEASAVYEDFTFFHKLMSACYGTYGHSGGSKYGEGSSSGEVPAGNQGQEENKMPIWLKNALVQYKNPGESVGSGGGDGGGSGGGGGGCPGSGGDGMKEDRLLVALKKRWGTYDTFSLYSRDPHFLTKYRDSLTKKFCFGCSDGKNTKKMLWANFPCKHLLWCSDCKTWAGKVVGKDVYNCVYCGKEVENVKLTLTGYAELEQPIGHHKLNEKEYPSLGTPGPKTPGKYKGKRFSSQSDTNPETPEKEEDNNGKNSG